MVVEKAVVGQNFGWGSVGGGLQWSVVLTTKLWLKGIYGPYVSQNIEFCHEVLGISPVDIRGGCAVDC